MNKKIYDLIVKKIDRMEEFFEEQNMSENVRVEARKRIKKATQSLIKWFKLFGVPQKFELDITGNADWMLIIAPDCNILFKDESFF